VSSDPEANGYSVHAAEAAGGWEVRIADSWGAVAWTRHCADETEARTYASTVQQHIYWLSREKFRQYYRLSQPAEAE
jgi:hypothetical protein